MASVDVHIEGVSGVVDAPLYVELINDTLATEWNGPVSVGGSANIPDLESGRYLARCRLPSGRILRRRCDLPDDEAQSTVVFKPGADSPHEGMEWTFISSDSSVLEKPRLRARQLRTIWLCLWKREPDGQWKTVPWPAQHATRHNHHVQYEFNFTAEEQREQYYLQIGGPTVAQRFVALPAGEIHVLVSPVEEPGREEDPVKVTVSTANQHAETLLGYLSRGAWEDASVVSQAVLAEELLYSKRSDPIAAAVGGYYLLRTGDLDRLHTWTENLANWTPWLPDGAVIRAWHLLLESDDNVPEARNWFVEAVRRGVPVFTEGLRLLYDGLKQLDEEAEGNDGEVREALFKTKKYAAVVDWYEPKTTFRGHAPDTPTAQRITGLPRDPEHAVILTDVQMSDLLWLGLIKPNASLVLEPERAELPGSLSEAALTAASPHLPMSLLEGMYDIDRTIPDVEHRALRLARLAPHLPGSLKDRAWQETIDVIDGLSSRTDRVRVLTELLRTGGEPQPSITHEAVKAALGLTNLSAKATALGKLGMSVPQDLLAPAAERIFDLCWVINDLGDRAVALASLAPFVPSARQAAALRTSVDAAIKATSEWAISESVCRVGPFVGGKLAHSMLPLAEELSGFERTKALAAIMNGLKGPWRERTREVVWDGIQEMLSLGWAPYFTAIAPYLDEPLWRRLVDMAGSVRRKLFRAEFLTACVDRVPSSLVPNVVDAYLGIKKQPRRDEILAQLAPYIPQSQIKDTLREAMGIKNTLLRAEALANLAPKATGSLRTRGLDALVGAIEDVYENSALRVTRLGHFEVTSPQIGGLSEPRGSAPVFRSLNTATRDLLGVSSAVSPQIWVTTEGNMSIDQLMAVARGERERIDGE